MLQVSAAFFHPQEGQLYEIVGEEGHKSCRNQIDWESAYESPVVLSIGYERLLPQVQSIRHETQKCQTPPAGDSRENAALQK